MPCSRTAVTGVTQALVRTREPSQLPGFGLQPAPATGSEARTRPVTGQPMSDVAQETVGVSPHFGFCRYLIELA